MIDPDQILAARQRINLAELIGRDVALKRNGHEFVGLCPFHNEKSPSFTVVPAKHFFHCFGCGAHGDAVAYLMRSRNLSFVDAIHDLLGLPLHAAPARRPSPRESAPVDEVSTPDLVRRIIRESALVGPTTAAWLYLWSRGLATDQPGLRAHPDLWCKEAQRKYPALIAPVKTSQGHISGIQRIWCLSHIPEGAKDSRAPLQQRKKSLGHLSDGCVRLAAAGPRMGIAEGVETAIAASMIYKIPTWATLGAARMATVWIPPECEHLTIFADRGEAGEAAAERAEAVHSGRGLGTSVVFPEHDAAGDQNDERAFYGEIRSGGHRRQPEAASGSGGA